MKKKTFFTGHAEKHKQSTKRAFSMFMALMMTATTIAGPMPLTVKAEEEDQRGSIKITKKDVESNLAESQGDAAFTGSEYQIINESRERILWNGVWYDAGSPVTTVAIKYDTVAKIYSAQVDNLPYGTYSIKESKTPKGYKPSTYNEKVNLQSSSKTLDIIDKQQVIKGGVSITKADADLGESKPQGDASLDGAEYEIVNKSAKAIFSSEKNSMIAPGAVVDTLTTTYDKATKTYVASTNNTKLPYGTYEIRETKAPKGYTKTDKTLTFSVTNDKEMHFFDNGGEISNTTESHHGWTTDTVIRGDVLVGKRDRDTAQYINLGGAHLDGATFEIVNKSKNPVVVNGETFDVNDVVMTIASEETKQKDDTIYAAISGNKALPYGTYDIYETRSGDGYLFDKQSKAYKKSISIREDGEVVDLTGENNSAYNKVMREDWHFIKKAGNEGLANVAFVVESMTTGERHVIVTNETGSWGSANASHTTNTNANDPTSPITNGALGVKENGEWYVADASKLDSEAGTWFTGLAEDKVEWAEDGKSYTLVDVDDTTLKVEDNLRAFPYDTYKVQELRSEANENLDLVNFTVTLHRYSEDHNGKGIDLDFGTVTDKWVAIATTLTNDKGMKVVPANTDAKLTDKTLYENLDINHEYRLEGELHLVNKDNKDEGVVATSEKTFTTKTSINTVNVDFDVDTTDMGGKKLVAVETLMDGDDVIVKHDDLKDEDQTVLVPAVTATLTGDLDHLANPYSDTVALQGAITYDGIEAGKTYEVKGALVNQETGEPIENSKGKEVKATTRFAAEETAGTVNINFNFEPDESLAGTSVAVIITLTQNETEYLSLTDLEDEDRIVRFPKVSDNLTDKADKGKDISEAVNQTVQDVINVAALDNDHSYTLVGELYLVTPDGVNAGKLVNDEGKTYSAETTWTGDKPDQALAFDKVDASKLGGYDIAVVPTLYGKRIENKKESDKKADTSAKTEDKSDDKEDSDDDADPDAEKSEAKEEDFKAAADPLTEDTDSKENTETDAKDTDDTKSTETEVPDTVKAELPEVDGEQVLLYSTLNVNEGQLVHVPHIDTVFLTETGTHNIQFKGEDKFTSTDTIFYTNLIPGKEYALDGSLHTWKVDKKEITDGGLLKLDRGTSEVSGTFVPEEKNGTVDVVYTFDGDLSKLDGQTVTAFEAISVGGKKLAVHEDITDEDQTIRFADLDAVLTSLEGLHEVQIPSGADKTVTLRNVIDYKGLVPDQVHTLTATLHLAPEDKASDKKKDAKSDGDVEIIDTESSNEVVATTTVTFKPVTVNGQIEAFFTFDASQLEGKRVVACDVITVDGKEVMSHKDLSDEDQTVRFITMNMEMIASNGLHIIQSTDDTVTATSTITYKNLVPNTKYTTVGSLHVQNVDADGKVTDGGEVKLTDNKASIEFTPKEANGTEVVTFTFNGADVKDKTVVAFEKLQRDGVTIASLENIADEAQAIHFANITPKLTFEDGSKEMTLPETETTVTVKGTIPYTNLIPGKEYTVVDELHVRSVGKEKVTDEGILANADGSAVTGTAKFTPTASSGSAEVTFTFASTGLRGNTLVAYTTISLDGKEIITHHDITDDEQAVSFAGKKVKADKNKKDSKKDKKAKKDTSKSSKDSSKTSKDSSSSKKSGDNKEVIKTGQISHYIFLAVLGLVLMGGAGFAFFRKRSE